MLRHPGEIIFFARELHGALPSLRAALRNVLNVMASELEEDLRAIQLLPELAGDSSQSISQVAHLITNHTLYAALDFIEQPQRRTEIRDRTIQFIQWIVEGARQSRGIGTFEAAVRL